MPKYELVKTEVSLIEEWNAEKDINRWLMLEDLVDLRWCYPATVWRCQNC